MIDLTLADIINERRLGPVHIGMPHTELFPKYLDFNPTNWGGYRQEDGARDFRAAIYRVDDVEILFGSAAEADGSVPICGFVIIPGRTARGMFSGGGVFSLDPEGMYWCESLSNLERVLATYGFEVKYRDDDQLIFETASRVEAAFEVQEDGTATFYKFLIFF